MGLFALVVDDSMLVRHTVCRFLEQRGFTVVGVTNGEEALAELRHARPNLIITDMKMPKMDGSQLISALKMDPATAKIPLVIVAARQSGFESTEKRADFMIFKDIDIESQLAKVLSSLFGSASAAGRS